MNSAVADCSKRIETEIGELREEVVKGNQGLAEIQDGLRDDMFDITAQVTKLHDIAEDHDIILSTQSVSISTINAKLDQLLKHFNITSSTFGSTSTPQTTGPITDPSSFKVPQPAKPSSPPVTTATPTSEAPSHSSPVDDIPVSEPPTATQPTPAP